MATRGLQNALANAYGNQQRAGVTSPTRQQRIDRRQAIRNQVNPGARPNPAQSQGKPMMPPVTGGLEVNPGMVTAPNPGVTAFSTAQMPPVSAPPSNTAGSAILGGNPNSTYMPKSAQQLGAPATQLSPYPEFGTGPVAEPEPVQTWNNPGIQGSTGAMPGPTSQPFTLGPSQPTAQPMPAKPQPKPGDASFGPALNTAGGW